MAHERAHERLHGRERELQAIEVMLDRARDGHGGALAITGDAGIGRTALLEAAVGRVTVRTPGSRKGKAFRVLGTTGVPGETAVPYAGLHRLLRPLAGEVARLPSAHRDALATILDGAPRAEPFVLFTAVCELLGRAARNGPVLCRADDVQWLDRGSLEVLAFAARRVEEEPVAVLFAVRDGRRDPGGLAGVHRLRLAPLDEDAGRRVLRDALGDAFDGAFDGAARGDLAEEIVDLACGRPAAIRDLAAALTPGQLSGAAPPPRALPAASALRALHRRRYLRLPAGARRLVLMAAAEEWLGAATVARAARADGIGAGDLDAARESGLLRFEGDGVTVRNRLVRSSLWADASREERQGAHALLTAALVQEWQAPPAALAPRGRVRRARRRARRRAGGRRGRGADGGPVRRLLAVLAARRRADRRPRHPDGPLPGRRRRRLGERAVAPGPRHAPAGPPGRPRRDARRPRRRPARPDRGGGRLPPRRRCRCCATPPKGSPERTRRPRWTR
ncbi:ATP-binding protein [Actinomadura madurae]|uniref:AAA family ATPase n=1 Tax=Actinomadura madurae TaxID=1993 RepID=UPI00399ACF89